MHMFIFSIYPLVLSSSFGLFSMLRVQFVLEQATGFPGASREDYAPTEVMDSDPAGFQEQVKY